MRPALCLLLLLFLARPDTSLAFIELESRLNPDNATDRQFFVRLEKVLAQTEKRLQEVFGMRPVAKAIVGPIPDEYDLLLATPASSSISKQTALLMINSRVAASYPVEDLQIAVARNLYLTIWPRFRKPFRADSLLAEKMYVEGMTAYAANLLYPGRPAWKYAGSSFRNGKGRYEAYKAREQELAALVLQAFRTGDERERADALFTEATAAASSWPTGSGPLLSYRLLKTFESELDHKMIQLMDFAEFMDRLPKGLESLRKATGTAISEHPTAAPN